MLPEGINPNDQIEVHWERDESGTKVTAALRGAKVTVECPPEIDAIRALPWLVASMPNVMEAAWATIEKEEQ